MRNRHADTMPSIGRDGIRQLILHRLMQLNFAAATVADLEGTLNNQATLVSRLTAECQSLTQRLEDNNLKHKYILSSARKIYIKDTTYSALIIKKIKL